MVLAEPIQIIQQVVTVLENLQIKYFIGGSLASSLHGIPRATQDIDLVADLTHDHVAALVDQFQAKFYISADMIRDAIRQSTSFNLVHLETMFKIDVFILAKGGFDQQRMTRRQSYQVSEESQHRLYLSTAEDIILHKLYWFQLGEETSERQWNDVLGVLQIQSEQLDMEYLQRSAQSFGLEELLNRARHQAKQQSSLPWKKGKTL